MNDNTPQNQLRKINYVRVLAFDLDNDVPIRDRVINLSQKDKREWLETFIVWATCNHKIIEITNIKDEE